MQVKFARSHAFTVLASIPPIVEPMEKTLKTKPKSSATKNEVEQNEDMIRGTLRAIEKLLRIDGAETCAVRPRIDLCVLPPHVVVPLKHLCVCVCVCVCVPQPLQDFVRSVCESEAFKAKWDVVVAESKVVGEA